MDTIIIRGAREHNLKNINLDLPRNKLIVISGLSGSGKSSLAFDTIFAEGQRRYMESLSSYARQFLGRLEKPDVDYIEGLSPAISIEQKTTHRNPRSTVGTVTEIYDYLRLLFARIGIPHCPSCGREIREQSIDQIIDAVNALPNGTRIMILAPVLRGKKGEHQRILEDAKRAGFLRVRIDGQIFSLEEPIQLEKTKQHSIDILIDRIVLEEEARKRMIDSLETALDTSGGTVVIVTVGEDGKPRGEQFFSQKSSCPTCGISLPELQPRLFSFNSPFGACPACSGLGRTLEFDPDLIMPDRNLSFNEGGIVPFNPGANWHRSKFESLAKHFNFSLDTPLKDLPPDILNIILQGTDEKVDVSYVNREGTGKFEYSASFKGILEELKRRYLETTSEGVKEWLEKFMTHRVCTSCNGARLKPESLAVTVGGKNIYEVSSLSIRNCLEYFQTLELSPTEQVIASQIKKEILSRLRFLSNVGLDYLTLHREASTLSGGEAQRIRLATQIGSSLVGVLYILDEPTIGLHQKDNQRLIETLFQLRDLGNTLIVVEHDEQTLRVADWIVDLGPGAGIHGGYVVAQGTPQQICTHPESLTGKYLSGRLQVPQRYEKRKGTGQFLILRGAREHNLKNIDVQFPLGKFVVITGVSGSGKSSLLTDLLYPVLMNRLQRTKLPEGDYDSIEGIEGIDKVILIDQGPIGRTPRSNPATYTGLFTLIREVFSSLPEARARGYGPGRFSFNVQGGRCENCKGDGTIRIEMHFLPDVYVTCDICKGKRFNRETLDIRYRGKNIHEVLEMTVEEAQEFFSVHPRMLEKLNTLASVGLGYIKLGQSALTFSGGEAQRIKLSLELSRRSTGSTLYILDEPTTGLHFADVQMLLDVLNRLVDRGNTVVLIEHNLDVIKQADWIIDLGPEGGEEGGHIVAEGTPEQVASSAHTHTAVHLQAVFQERR
ncbi:MAG TPA: excinuclease ABC subunit UvrA [Spirochaetales bacterium]|nr:excinuclease ABC subunit UvrA [Spirochaetales bacterium]